MQQLQLTYPVFVFYVDDMSADNHIHACNWTIEGVGYWLLTISSSFSMLCLVVGCKPSKSQTMTRNLQFRERNALL